MVEKVIFGNPFHEKDERKQSFDDGTLKYKTRQEKTPYLSLFWVPSAFGPPEVYSSQGRQAFLMDGTRLCSIEVYDMANRIFGFSNCSKRFDSSLQIQYDLEQSNFWNFYLYQLLLFQKISPPQPKNKWLDNDVPFRFSHFGAIFRFLPLVWGE